MAPYVVAAAVAVAGVVLAGQELARHISTVEGWIAGLGPVALLAFVPVYALLSSVFVPDILLGIVAGAAFGFPWGVTVVAAGSLAGALLQYALSRHLLKRTIDRVLASRPALTAIQAAVRREQLKLQLLIRLTPLNRAITSYVLGAAGVDVARFAVACLGLLPSIALEVYFGYAGKHLTVATARSGQDAALQHVSLLAGLATAIVVMVVISRTARRAVEAAAATSGPRAAASAE